MFAADICAIYAEVWNFLLAKKSSIYIRGLGRLQAKIRAKIVSKITFLDLHLVWNRDLVVITG